MTAFCIVHEADIGIRNVYLVRRASGYEVVVYCELEASRRVTGRFMDVNEATRHFYAVIGDLLGLRNGTEIAI